MLHDTDLRLDGNAAAGLLAEVFTVEATTAVAVCDACGATGAVGSTHVYDRGPGVVVRCPGCAAVLMRFTHTRGELIADLRGVATIAFKTGG
jgi:N-acetylglucosamine-6-phosphate deacetylase